MEMITYGCTKTYFSISENGFFVYSNAGWSIYYCYMFHKLYIFFLNVVDAFFYVKHNNAFYVTHIYTLPVGGLFNQRMNTFSISVCICGCSVAL